MIAPSPAQEVPKFHIGELSQPIGNADYCLVVSVGSDMLNGNQTAQLTEWLNNDPGVQASLANFKASTPANVSLNRESSRPAATSPTLLSQNEQKQASSQSSGTAVASRENRLQRRANRHAKRSARYSVLSYEVIRHRA